MAWFKFNCEEHGAFKASLLKRETRQPCPTCGKPSKNILGAGSVRVVERLDNGAMGRAVERLHNIEELMDERNRKHEEMTTIRLPDEDN